MIELPNVFNSGFRGNLVESELKDQAARYRRLNQLPHEKADWDPAALRAKIWASLGVTVDHSLPLETTITGEIKMDGYRVQKVSYLSRPGVRVTGNLYIPDGKGPFPAVINMHGHWSQGRLAARVQQRGHLLAKSGYVVLAVDAFGAGERTPVHGVYTSHGGLLGGAPLQFGESLMGLQVVDNMRGVDLLTSLPYVIKDRIGACGASGGGNQTMWLAAMDERITAAVPVVSVGTFESYIICPNCICEVLPGGLTYTEESGVLALAAPRAMMPINGSHDVNPAFNPARTRESVDEAMRIFRALGVPRKLRQVVLEEPHAFSPDGQRALLGWFELHLKGKGDGDPVKELPVYSTLPESEVMVYAKGTRPADVVSLPEYCRAKEAYWRQHAKFSKRLLREILVLENVSIRHARTHSALAGWERVTIEASDNRLMPLIFKAPRPGVNKVAIFGIPYKKLHFYENKLLQKMIADGIGIVIIDHYGTGENDLRIDPEYRDRFINRSLLWMGKNAQGKWVEDFYLAEEWLKNRMPSAEIAAAGYEESTIAASCYAALRPGKTDIYLEKAPATLGYSKAVSGKFGQTFIVPGILKCADMPDLHRAAGGKVFQIDVLK